MGSGCHRRRLGSTSSHGAAKRADELGHKIGNHTRIDNVLRVHVRRRHDRPRPISNRRRSERETVGHPSRPVIDTSKHMKVNLDETQTTPMIDAARRDSVTIP